MNSNWIAETFKNFAMLECEGSSELYKTLALNIAEDEEILELSSNCKEGQPIPNLLFGAVHYLLFKKSDHQLREFYPSIVSNPNMDKGPFPYFKDFCLTNREEILLIVKNKLVQTNEVRRCAYLYPIFCAIYQWTKKPLSLIEIGSSAGLQLLLDKYSYSYGGNEVYGNKESIVHLTSEVRNGNIPSNLSNIPPVNYRLGIDLHISDLTNEEDSLWLKALIWPEHKDRLDNFEQSVKLLKMNPPQLREGDGVAMLNEYAAKVPKDSALCIFHTHVANQMPRDIKGELLQKVDMIGSRRDTFHVYNNIHDRKLHLDSYMNGNKQHIVIGDTDGHGRWFDWNLQSESLE